MKNTKLLLINSIMLCSAYNVSSAMAGKPAVELLKTGIKKFTTSLHWTIAAGPSAIMGLDQFSRHLNQNNKLAELECTPADPAIRKKMRELSGNNQYPAILKFGAPKDFDVPPLAHTINHLIISPEVEKKIQKAIQNNDHEILEQWQKLLENGKKDTTCVDLRLIGGAFLAMPIVTHIGSRVAHRYLFSGKNLVTSFIWQQVIKVPTGFGKLGVTTATECVILNACDYPFNFDTKKHKKE